MGAFETAMRNAVRGEAREAARDVVLYELCRILDLPKSGEQIIAERLQDAVLSLTTVKALTSLTTVEINRQMTLGKFPAPVAIGRAAEGWLLSEVGEWIAARKAERDAAERARNDAVAQAALDAMARERREAAAHAELARKDVAASKQNARSGKASAMGNCNV